MQATTLQLPGAAELSSSAVHPNSPGCANKTPDLGEDSGELALGAVSCGVQEMRQRGGPGLRSSENATDQRRSGRNGKAAQSAAVQSALPGAGALRGSAESEPLVERQIPLRLGYSYAFDAKRRVHISARILPPGVACFPSSGTWPTLPALGAERPSTGFRRADGLRKFRSAVAAPVPSFTG